MYVLSDRELEYWSRHKTKRGKTSALASWCAELLEMRKLAPRNLRERVAEADRLEQRIVGVLDRIEDA